MKQVVSTLAFLLRDDEILLAMKKRDFGKGKWNGAGGKVAPGETIEQALVRETQEEISVTPTEYKKVAYHVFNMDVDTEEPWQMLVHTFFVTKWKGEPQESEEMAPKWFKTPDIPYASMWEDDQYWLPQVLLGELVKTEFAFETNDKLLTQNVVKVSSF